MKNILFLFFASQHKCLHKNALLYTDSGYCPDCGKYLTKKYYIVRCARCDIKRETIISFGEIMPKSRFCTNCGCDEYYIEQIDKVNFIDAQYATCIKEEVENITEIQEDTQVWVDKENGITKRLTG